MSISSTPRTAATTAGANFRSWLSRQSDTQLLGILAQRPDTAFPLPPGINPWATRLLLASSISRALSRCSAAQLACVEEVAAAGGELGPVPTADLRFASEVPGLLERALLFADESSAVQVPSAVLSALPTGFSVLRQTPVTAATVDALPPAQRRVLEQLIDTGVGTTRDAAPDADPTRPIPCLLAAGLLERVDAQTVRLPRAVRDLLRGVEPLYFPTQPSGRAGTPAADAQVDSAGAAAGCEVVRLLTRLIEYLGLHPLELLKDKSVGVRNVAAINKALATEHAAALIDLGFHTGLLGRGEPTGWPEGNYLAPTQLAEQWNDASLPARLEWLQDSWRNSPWAWWDSARALDPETSSAHLPRQRETVLEIFRTSTPRLSRAEFWEELRFRRPLFTAHTQPSTVEAVLTEAEWLGVLAHGGIVQSHPIPAEVDSFILQADLTVLAPGPLVADIARRLETFADLESPGLASVYRVGEQSLRRGMDAGYTGAEIAEFFQQHAHGEVPQAITYLIADVARRHGSLRAGLALSYLRCDDAPLLAQATATVPGLRLLAPTVAVSATPLGELLNSLRAAGFAPAAEDEHGATIDSRPAPALLPPPRPSAPRQEPAVDFPAALQALRAGDNQPPAADSPVDTLQAAVRAQHPVTITYADKDGQPRQLSATPVSVAGGHVDALTTDARTVRLPIPRIVSVEFR